MNERLHDIMMEATKDMPHCYYWPGEYVEKFAELLIEDVLNEVKDRAYYTGDRDWSDEVDRPWIQLEFGYGSLHDAKSGIFK